MQKAQKVSYENLPSLRFNGQHHRWGYKVYFISPVAGVIIQQLLAEVDCTIADSSSALDGKTSREHKVW